MPHSSNSFPQKFTLSSDEVLISARDDFFDTKEGQLSVDIIQTEHDLYIVSTLAGADTQSLEVNIHDDILTIRGVRSNPIKQIQEEHEYFHTECFWGTFSRTIVLPVDVRGELAKAEFKSGVLTIRIPKRHARSSVPIRIVEE